MAASNHHRRNPLLRTAQTRPVAPEAPAEAIRSATEYLESVPAKQENPSKRTAQLDENSEPSVLAVQQKPPTEAEIFYPPPKLSLNPDAFISDIEEEPQQVLLKESAAEVYHAGPLGAVELEEEIWVDPAETSSDTKLSPLSLGIRVLFDLLLIGAALFVLQRPDPQPIALQPPPTAAPTATATAMATPGPITVFVSGAVREPALYRVAPDARVADAIAMAGGLLEDADSALLNQAELLFDGAQVHVPTNAPPFQSADAQSADAQSLGVQTIGSLTQPSAGVSGNASPASGTASTGGLINLNTASVDALTSLPGIGPSKAANIIAGRPYSTVDDLERVSGIGAKTVEQLRDLVTVQ